MVSIQFGQGPSTYRTSVALAASVALLPKSSLPRSSLLDLRALARSIIAENPPRAGVWGGSSVARAIGRGRRAPPVAAVAFPFTMWRLCERILARIIRTREVYWNQVVPKFPGLCGAVRGTYVPPPRPVPAICTPALALGNR